MLESAKIERKALLTVVMDGVESIERVEVKSITLAPAQRTGLHRHPCTVVGYIAEGTISFQIEGQPAKVRQQLRLVEADWGEIGRDPGHIVRRGRISRREHLPGQV